MHWNHKAQLARVGYAAERGAWSPGLSSTGLLPKVRITAQKIRYKHHRMSGAELKTTNLG